MATKAEQQVALLKQLEQHFERQDNVNSNALASELNWEHSAVVGILKSLEMMGKIETEAQLHVEYALTEEGEEILREGSPEVRLMNMLPKQVDSIKEDPVLARGMAQCLKNKWAVKKGDLLEVMSMPLGDPLQTALQGVKSGAVPTDAAGLQKRKMVVKSSVTYFVPRPTALFSTELAKQLVDLDRSILQTGEWRGAEFKPYNFNAAGIAPCFGSIHPLIKTMNMFRQILQQMNFEEMDTRRWVESSFWNFDALFQPQTHPVRDAHDTFFLKHPARSMDVAEQVALHEQLVSEGKALDGPRALDNISEATHLMDQTYFERVKEIHESGDHESHGWQFPWDAEESYKLILRTHTTAVTSRILRHLAMEYQKNPDVKIDRRFFSIDRVFRNETLDATHLAEFHQIEGIVASTTASLSELMGIIKTFFAKIGINDVEFKPAYNPYTEPSMEIFGFHPTLNKWTEIGNSGVFRPEMLRPMGLPEDLVVLGWGLSLERPTMINYNVKDIRELIDIVREGDIDKTLDQVRECSKILSRQLQNLVNESRGSLTKATSHSAKISQIWSDVDGKLLSLHTDINASLCEGKNMDTSDWKQAVEQYELLELIAEFLNETENLPDAIPNSITQLLHASSNNGLIMISVPRNLEALRKFDITRERVDKLTNLMDRMRQQVLHHLQVALDARDQQTLVGCLMIMDNMGVLDYEIIRSLIIDDCLQLINECQTLEQCVAMIKPFSTAILKASAVKVAAQSLATIQCHEELQALRKIRQNMWKELAIKLSVSVKNVLEKSQSPTITSMAEFQIGLKRLSMAKELQNNLNLMGEPNSPRIQLRLAGTNTQLNNYITQVFIRHSTKLTVLEDSIHDARFELGCIPKSEGLKAIELLNEFVKVVEENHGASPLIEETIVTWLHLIDKINTDCISSGYSRSYLMNNIVKPSRLLSNRVARLD